MKNNVNLIVDRERLLRDIKERTPKSQGNLVNSLQLFTEQKIGKFEVDLQALDYFQYVDAGRKPGKFPPPNTLKNWVKKNLRPAPKQLNSLIYLAARSIAKNGTKGANILKDIDINDYIIDFEVNIDL